jgi:hypothetical protein
MDVDLLSKCLPAGGTIAAVDIHGTSACSAGSSAKRLHQFLRRVEGAMSQLGPTRTICGIIGLRRLLEDKRTRYARREIFTF